MYLWKYYIAIVLFFGSVSPAAADDSVGMSAEQKKDEAIEHFKQGVTHFDSKNFEGALEHFEAAYGLNPSWKLFYNIAHCQAALKLYGMAVVTFERYLAEGGDQVPDARRDEVLAELERMRKMIGDIEVVAPDGLHVYVDNVHRGVTPLPGVICVSAGLVHRIELRENDAVLFDAERMVRGGGTARVEYSLEAPPVPPSENDTAAAGTNTEIEVTSPPPTEKGRKKLSPVPFIVASSATVLLGGATIALAAYVGSKNDDVASQDDADKLNTLRKVGIGTLAGTAAAGITAVILAVFTDFTGKPEEAPVSLYGTHEGGGIVVGGHF
ncbi:MAG: tetratricopeptide repeat protein [Deltaproteobacteria bacterium]|nr:tetratricopeptide repeat protein [Deltaproteobacteria bacterium]MBN2670475.1 tetratricopeptide repeat protein [Deltaproteobacteria bacterium]